ncbi:unnamed protein product [Cochlearia groenlandica]
MAPKPQNKCSNQEFPPMHPLTEFDGSSIFCCDGCKTPGSGKRYRCKPCNYDLHEDCFNSPINLKTFMHRHEINLVFLNHKSIQRLVDRVCDICNQSVIGLFYRCNMCEFDVHVSCTQLPQHCSLDVHPDHPLRFSPAGLTPCVLCHSPGIAATYRCKECKFDIHIECIAIAGIDDESSSDQTEASGSEIVQTTSRGSGRRMFKFAAKLAVDMVSESIIGVTISDFMG